MPNLNTGLTAEQVLEAFYRALHDLTDEQITALLAEKQNTLTFDNSPTSGSDNPVTSNGIRAAITDAIGNLYASSKGGTGKYIQSISETNGVISATAETMDTAPTASSTKAVTSGGVKTYVDDAVQDKITITNILGAGTRIEATESAPINLNDLTAVGRYNWLSRSTAYMTPLPVSGKGGLLEVSYIQGNSTILQKVYLSDGANSPTVFYQRFRYGSGTESSPITWTGWYKFEGTAVT